MFVARVARNAKCKRCKTQEIQNARDAKRNRCKTQEMQKARDEREEMQDAKLNGIPHPYFHKATAQKHISNAKGTPAKITNTFMLD